MRLDALILVVDIPRQEGDAQGTIEVQAMLDRGRLQGWIRLSGVGSNRREWITVNLQRSYLKCARWMGEGG